MNVWIPQDSFHEICIALWANGFNEKEWEPLFKDCEEPYNKDWVCIYMEMLNEDLIAYMRKPKDLIHIVNDDEINNILMQEPQS